MNRHRLAADAVLLLHFAFVLFAVFGGFLVLLDRRWMWLHIPSVLWSSIVNLASWTCPLTPLEKGYRQRVGKAYDGGFVQHYIAPGAMPRQLELVSGISILVWNVIVYAIVISLRAGGL